MFYTSYEWGLKIFTFSGWWWSLCFNWMGHFKTDRFVCWMERFNRLCYLSSTKRWFLKDKLLSQLLNIYSYKLRDTFNPIFIRFLNLKRQSLCNPRLRVTSKLICTLSLLDYVFLRAYIIICELLLFLALVPEPFVDLLFIKPELMSKLFLFTFG